MGEVNTFKIQMLYPWMESVGIYLIRFGRQDWEESERNKKGFLMFVFTVCSKSDLKPLLCYRMCWPTHHFTARHMPVP